MSNEETFRLNKLESSDGDRRLKFKVYNEDICVGEIDIILYSDFLKQHDYDPTYIHEVSIKIFEKYRKKGYGEKAINELIKIASNEKIAPLWSIVHESNCASIKLHEKLNYINKKPYRKYINNYVEVYVCYQLL